MLDQIRSRHRLGDRPIIRKCLVVLMDSGFGALLASALHELSRHRWPDRFLLRWSRSNIVVVGSFEKCARHRCILTDVAPPARLIPRLLLWDGQALSGDELGGVAEFRGQRVLGRTRQVKFCLVMHGDLAFASVQNQIVAVSILIRRRCVPRCV